MEKAISIEALTEAELPQLAPLMARFRVALKAFKGIDAAPDEEGAAAELREYLDAGFPVFSARIGETICGFVVCRVDAPCVWVEALYVLPDFRRRGVATALFRRAEELAASFGEETVYNCVHPNNDGIIQFLRSQGYSVLNLIEIRKPCRGEKLTRQIRVAEHQFDY